MVYLYVSQYNLILSVDTSFQFPLQFWRKGSLKVPPHLGVPHPQSVSGLLEPRPLRIPMLCDIMALLYAIST